jgi:REP element-mobilizing transposase RayT
MPRANRYFLPGQVYHLTHRCHNRQFRKRYRILDFERLKALLGGVEADCVRRHDEALILETIAKDSMKTRSHSTLRPVQQ